MRGIWGLLGLVVALAIVAMLVKQQMAGSNKTLAQPATGGKNESVRVQSQQVQQQVRQAMEAAMAAPRRMPEDQ
ncbi:MAG: hypothetical protein WBC18_02155 [Ottowia sp.]|uniref:hypothetical protein n=1 Tax=unclassified Ottowia TaxID=2645081 RepID=UPI003C2C913A